jgi:hypothetical protein
MSATISQALDLLRVGVAQLDPDTYDGPGATALAKELAEITRLSEAGTTLMARRVRDTGAWAHDGVHRDAAGWLAGITGETLGRARATIDTGLLLTELPETEAALREGRLSASRASDLATAASADPAAERKLLESATGDGSKTFKQECARVRAAARTDEAENYEHIRRMRSVRHWEDEDGAGRIDVRGPVDVTARIMMRIERCAEDIFQSVRASGAEYERSSAYAFDGLAAMAEASIGAQPGTARDDVSMVVRIDLDALRGWTEPGEICEIRGVGPIPVPVALRMAKDAFLKAVVTDGVDVHSVVHLGRKPPALLRTAIEELHQSCAREGCDATRNLDIDHNVPWSEGGETRLSNLNPACKPDHREKHRKNLRFEGTASNKRLVPARLWSGSDPPRRT